MSVFLSKELNSFLAEKHSFWECFQDRTDRRQMSKKRRKIFRHGKHEKITETRSLIFE